MTTARSILEKLKNIIGVEFRDFLSSNDIGDISLIKFSKAGGDTYNITNNYLMINPSRLGQEQRNQIKQQIIDAELNEDYAILKDESIERMSNIKKNIPSSSDEKLLDFYSDKLSADYVKALEASLIVRNMARHGIDIGFAKKDIMRKYPVFGRNLCNLTSEDYFHGHFKELYESMSKEDDFSIKAYQKQVEKIVTGLPYIVFVSSIGTVRDKVIEISSKLARLKKYGAGKLLIHALRRDNVEKTEEILKKIKDADSSIEIELDKKTSRMTATLRFKGV